MDGFYKDVPRTFSSFYFKHLNDGSIDTMEKLFEGLGVSFGYFFHSSFGEND